MNEQQWLECKDPARMLAFLDGKAGQRKLRLFTCGCCRRLWELFTDSRSQAAIEMAEAQADGERISRVKADAVAQAARRAAVEAEYQEARADEERGQAVTADQDARQEARESDVSPAMLLQRAAEAARAEVALREATARTRLANLVASDLLSGPPGPVIAELAEAAGLMREAALYGWQATTFQQRADREADRPARRSRSGRAARLVAVYQWIDDAWEETQTKADPVAHRAERAESAAQCGLLRDVVGNPFRRVPVIERAWLSYNDGAVAKVAAGIYEDRSPERMSILADALEDAGCAEAALLEHCRQPGGHARGCWVVDLLLGKG